MLSFWSILVAAAAFATIVSAVPTPEIGSGLVQRSTVTTLDGLPITGDDLVNLPETFGSLPPLGNLATIGGGITQSKRGGAPSCYERIKQCHDNISVIVVKIGWS